MNKVIGINMNGFSNANDILKGEQAPKPQYYTNNPLNRKLGRVGKQIPPAKEKSASQQKITPGQEIDWNNSNYTQAENPHYEDYAKRENDVENPHPKNPNMMDPDQKEMYNSFKKLASQFPNIDKEDLHSINSGVLSGDMGSYEDSEYNSISKKDFNKVVGFLEGKPSEKPSDSTNMYSNKAKSSFKFPSEEDIKSSDGDSNKTAFTKNGEKYYLTFHDDLEEAPFAIWHENQIKDSDPEPHFEGTYEQCKNFSKESK